MDKQFRYVLTGAGIGVPAMLAMGNLSSLLKDPVAWFLIIALVCAGMIALIAELYMISRRLLASRGHGQPFAPARVCRRP